MRISSSFLKSDEVFSSFVSKDIDFFFSRRCFFFASGGGLFFFGEFFYSGGFFSGGAFLGVYVFSGGGVFLGGCFFWEEEEGFFEEGCFSSRGGVFLQKVLSSLFQKVFISFLPRGVFFCFKRSFFSFRRFFFFALGVFFLFRRCSFFGGAFQGEALFLLAVNEAKDICTVIFASPVKNWSDQ